MFLNQTSRSRSSFHPWLEVLEDRRLLAFGVGGVAVTSLGDDDRPWAGALQSDGKIIAAGVTFTGSTGTGQDFALARWNADGSLDTGFGQGGKVITNMSTPTFGSDRIWGVSLQADGKIVASGSALAGRRQEGMALARYLPNGTLDASFGNGGKVITSGASGRDNVIQPDGKIVVIGTSGDFALFRYHANGTLDNSFGTKGKVFTDFGGNDLPEAVVLQTDGKIVVAGRRGSEIVLARYHANGNLDMAFGQAGKVITDLGPGMDQAYAMALQADGKIVVAGVIDGETAQSKFAVVRYTSNGSLDTTFDGDGIVTVEFAGSAPYFDVAYAVAVQSDGKIVVGGVGDNDYFALARLRSDGSLDPTFGTGGRVATNTNPQLGSPDGATGLFIQPADQKIVAVGLHFGEGAYDFAAVRYHPDGSLDAGAALRAASTPHRQPAERERLTVEDAQPLLTEALARWQASGVDSTRLGAIAVRIADLGGTYLGLALGNTLWLDTDAAGWGWFIDTTPWDDSEFTTPGDQGEHGRMDLLSVLMHELGHLLGFDHDEGGAMAETLTAGTRWAVVPGDTSHLVADSLFTLLTVEEKIAGLRSNPLLDQRRWMA